MIASIVRLLRFASIAICLIVIASFFVFAVDQTKSASGHQQEQLASEVPGAASPSSSQHASRSHESGVHEVLDEASRELTSPFSGVVSGSHSQWTIRSVELALALLVYGFGLGYLARVLSGRG